MTKIPESVLARPHLQRENSVQMDWSEFDSEIEREIAQLTSPTEEVLSNDTPTEEDAPTDEATPPTEIWLHGTDPAYYLLSRDEADQLLLLTDELMERANRIMIRVMAIEDALAAQNTHNKT